MRVNHQALAYALLRIAFGINFAGHGFIRIAHGTAAFAQSTAEHLAKSPLPHPLVLGFGFAIPILEAALGLALIFGLCTRAALALGAVFMMALTIGVTADQQWDVAGQQLLYSLVFFVLLFLVQHNVYALDTLWQRDRPRSIQ